MLEHSLFTDLIKQEFDKSNLKHNTYVYLEAGYSKIMKENNWISDIAYNRKRLHFSLVHKTTLEAEQGFYKIKSVVHRS